MQQKMIAEIAYSNYAKASQNKNVRGEALPLWNELDQENQNAWITATQAVRNVKLADLADGPLVSAFDRLRLAAGDPQLTVEEGETVEIALIDHIIDRLAAGSATKAA